MPSAIVEARMRELQAGRAQRDAKRAEAAAKQSEREERSTVSPRDLEAARERERIWQYWTKIRLNNEERERQQKINKANPTLIALKNEFMADGTSSTRRTACVEQFSDLYRRSYGKAVPVEVIAAEWGVERRKTILARIYGATR